MVEVQEFGAEGPGFTAKTLNLNLKPYPKPLALNPKPNLKQTRAGLAQVGPLRCTRF